MTTKDDKGGVRKARDDKVVSLGRDIQVKIGQHLRTMYDEVVKQGVPDHLNDLLQQLDEPRNKSKARDRGSQE
ncbi:MAG TPA: NepR family anti-sigma factor [Devosia sp.]|nr:NepR family anti-sigma factor [Devosia sp.]